jgi:DNA ligase 1
VLFDDLAAATEAVAATSLRNAKVATLAAALRSLEPDEVAAGVAFLTGKTTLGRIGVGWATLSDVRVDPAATPSLTVHDVQEAVEELAAMAGAGVVAGRRARLATLLGAATAREQYLIHGILGGELRQGALDGVMATAIAQAAGAPVASVRRAAMMAGDLGVAAATAMAGGQEALDAVSLEPGRPVMPMLASPAPDIVAALDVAGGAPVAVEAKLDGARVQAHRVGGPGAGSAVGLFTRNLNEVTDRLHGVAAFVQGLPGGDLVLDGEVLGVLDDGSPRRFQDTMGDFGAELPAGRGATLRAFFFDVLYAEGRPLHDEPLSARRELLARIVPEASRPAATVTADAVEADDFAAGVLKAGHEGVIVKDLDSPYAAGRRGASWRKVKPVTTLDLVVLAVEWGHGRRQGWLSNLHLGARGPDGFVMVGKTFKGLTDELLRWQTERFLGLETHREGHIVHVRPEQVVEVAIDGVQGSPRYPGGVALRFARVKTYRHDKSADEADTIETIQAILARSGDSAGDDPGGEPAGDGG